MHKSTIFDRGQKSQERLNAIMRAAQEATYNIGQIILDCGITDFQINTGFSETQEDNNCGYFDVNATYPDIGNDADAMTHNNTVQNIFPSSNLLEQNFITNSEYNMRISSTSASIPSTNSTTSAFSNSLNLNTNNSEKAEAQVSKRSKPMTRRIPENHEWIRIYNKAFSGTKEIDSLSEINQDAIVVDKKLLCHIANNESNGFFGTSLTNEKTRFKRLLKIEPRSEFDDFAENYTEQHAENIEIANETALNNINQNLNKIVKNRPPPINKYPVLKQTIIYLRDVRIKKATKDYTNARQKISKRPLRPKMQKQNNAKK